MHIPEIQTLIAGREGVRGADIGSDHHLVIATFQLKLKRYSGNPTTKRLKFQVNLLQGNKITDFGITLKNRFQPLEHLDEDMETYWSQVKDSFISTCKEVLGEKDYKHKDWISQESLNRLSERREKKAAVNDSRTRDRDTLWKLLRHYGIPPKIVTLIQKMYDGTSCKVLHEGRQTDSFEIKTGVRQGCLLSPFLFILAVDWLMKESTSGSRNGIQWTLWTQLDDLDFADDIALVSHNHSQMQDKTSTVKQLSGSIGLRIHPGKSKMLKIKTEDTQAITVGGKPLEVVENFSYLGSVIDHSGGTAADVRSRVAKARAAFETLDKKWRDRTISTKTKIRLFNSNVKSALLYGCETWSLNQSSLKKFQTFVNGCLRRILRIFWPERIRNEELRNRAGQRPISEEITQTRWRWLGHTLRKPRNSSTRQSLQWNPQGKQSRGRPRTTWRRNLEEEMKASGHSWRNITRMAQDRREWGTVVRGLYPLQGEWL